MLSAKRMIEYQSFSSYAKITTLTVIVGEINKHRKLGYSHKVYVNMLL